MKEIISEPYNPCSNCGKNGTKIDVYDEKTGANEVKCISCGHIIITGFGKIR